MTFYTVSNIPSICHFKPFNLTLFCLQLERNLLKQFSWHTLLKDKRKWPISLLVQSSAPTAGASVHPYMLKHPAVFCVVALNDDMHSKQRLRGDETCSLPGNCCLHMLQIRKCTWQRKWCGKALKTQDFRKIWTQPCRTFSRLLLRSHCVFVKLSSFITSLPELPFLSISDCKYSWICWSEKKTEGKRREEMSWNSKFQKEGRQEKGKLLF